jgi:hypothetical protein
LSISAGFSAIITDFSGYFAISGSFASDLTDNTRTKAGRCARRGGVDNGTKASLKASAIPASEFQREILNLSRHGRVLVLLDACRSAGLIDGAPGANLLSSAVAAGNVTVLTSSRADKLSREDEAWQHGAFTKVLLDALSDDDVDTDQNGVISMSDLTAYMEKRLDLLTGGDQQLGVEQRFQGEIFVVGL